MTKSQYKALIIKQAGILDKVRQLSDLGGNSVFAPANISKLSHEKFTPNSYYLKVENEHIGRPVKIGVMEIDGLSKKQSAIDEYNKFNKADMPSIIDNPFYYIVNNHLRLSNFRTMAYNDLQRAFFKGRSAKSVAEVQDVELGPNRSHGMAEFVTNSDMKVLTFRASAINYRILIATLARSK